MPTTATTGQLTQLTDNMKNKHTLSAENRTGAFPDWLRVLFTLMALLCGSALAAQTGSIEGTVSPEGSANFLDGATVQLAGTNFRTSSDRSGRFSFNNIPNGEYILTVRFVGFETFTRSITVNNDVTRVPVTLRSDRSDVFELDEFVVVSEASGTERALSRQFAAQNTISIIASDSFGLLPDSTIADAVRRLPGINVEQDQGRAGRYVTIRGMNADFNSVTVNNQRVTVSNFDGASRSVPLDVVPANNAESIEVTKTALPSMSADAIGGSINIRSRSAFDRSTMRASAEAAVGMLSLAGDYFGNYPHDNTPYKLSASWSDRINADGTLGLAVSFNHNDRPFLFRSVENGPYVLDGDEYFTSYGRLEEAFDNVQSTGLTTRLDWRPSQRFEVALDVNYTVRESQQGSQRATGYYDTRYLLGPFAFNGDTAVKFTSEDRSEREVRDYFEEQKNLNLTVQFKHMLGEWTIDYGAGLNQGDFAGDPDKDLRAFFRTGFRGPDGSFLENSYELVGGSGFTPLYGDNITTLPPEEFELFEVRRDTRIIDDTILTGFLNVKRDMLWGSLPGYLKGGLMYQNSDRDFRDLRRRYRTADTTWNLTSVVINGNEQVYGSVLADYGIERALNGQAFPAMIDPVKVREAEAALAAAGLRDRGDANWYLNQNVARDARADLVNSYDLREEVVAAYVESLFQWQALSVIAGFRVEHTDVRVNTYSGDFFESRPTDPLFIRPVVGKNDYTNLFPHLHLRYDVSHNFVLRASVNQTLARPSYRQLNPSEDIDPTANNDDGLVISGRTDLDPVISTNLDFSVDYFFAPRSRVSVAAFYKDMKDNIYRLRRNVQPGDPSYYPATAEVREFLNADGAQVYGVELSVDYDLANITEWLHGFSISANYTYTNSKVDGIQRQNPAGADLPLITESGQTPLFGQVPHTVNVALHFARWNFESRLALNWSDAYLDFNGINLDPNLDDYIDARTRVDFSLRCRIGSNWSIFLEVQNLLNNDSRAYSGNRDTRMYYREEIGRAAMIGVNWTL